MGLLVEDVVVRELKSVESIAPVHQPAVLTYLRLTGETPGLLLDFNVVILKDGVERLVFNRAAEVELRVARSEPREH